MAHPIFIFDKEGKRYTSFMMADITNLHVSTICLWNREGTDTYEKMVDRANKYHFLKNRKYNTCRGKMTCREVADTPPKTDTSLVYGRAKRHGWKSPVIFWGEMSRKDLTNRLKKEGLYIPTKQPTVKYYEKGIVDLTTGKKLKLCEVAKMVGRANYTISIWYNKFGCKTLQDCYARLEYLNKYPKGRLSMETPKFIPPSSLEAKI